jgi:uncharacterized protein
MAEAARDEGAQHLPISSDCNANEQNLGSVEFGLPQHSDAPVIDLSSERLKREPSGEKAASADPVPAKGTLISLRHEHTHLTALGHSGLDRERFKEIQREATKKNFGDVIKSPEKMKETDRGTVRIPSGGGFETPRFKFGKKGGGGVSAGDGEQGDPIGPGDKEGSGKKAGESGGDFQLEQEVTIEQLAELLGEHLRLPNIQKKKSGTMTEQSEKLKSLSNVGPNSRLDKIATHRKAMERAIGILGDETEAVMNDPEAFAEKVLEQYPDSKRFHDFRPEPKPHHRAVVGLIMDVSGSMGDREKELVRVVCFWLDTWLRHQYDDVHVRYVVHTTEAEEVDQYTFFHTKESGGTKISAAYEKMEQILDEYPAEDWNTYIFQFSDGDNFGNDNNRCVEIAKRFMDRVNQFAYGQVDSAYGSGDYLRTIRGAFKEDDSPLATAKIESREDIVGALMRFLGKGR